MEVLSKSCTGRSFVVNWGGGVGSILNFDDSGLCWCVVGVLLAARNGPDTVETRATKV